MRWRVAPTPRLSGVRNLLIDIEIYLPRGPPVSLLSRKIGKAWAMRVLIVGDRGNADGRAEGLGAEGAAVARCPDASRAAPGPAEIAAIARDLREFERALGGARTDA